MSIAVNNMRHYLITILKAFLIMFVLGVFNISFAQLVGTNATVTMLNGAAAPKFSCNKLYAGADGSDAVAQLLEVNPVNGALTPIMRGPATAQVTPLLFHFNTIALGHYNGEEGLTMYSWWYGAGAGTGGPYDIFWAVKDGSRKVYRLKQNKPVASSTYLGWSGGEVNQNTGEIYITGQQDTRLNSAPVWTLMVLDPVTGTYRKSNMMIQPETSLDTVTTSNTSMASDMAIDANGNGYFIVGGKDVIRIDIQGKSPSQWKYKKLFSFPSQLSTSNIWGMAFLNGKLYASTAVGSIYEINLLTQTSKQIVGAQTPLILDLSSCQVAPVIEGTIYNDVQGVGAHEVPLENIPVEIWKVESGKPVYKSTVRTNGNGQYTFVLDETDGEYYVRVPVPSFKYEASNLPLYSKLGNMLGIKTWSGISQGDNYSGISYCFNNRTEQMEELQGESKCLGRYTDSPAKKGDPSTWANYSKVKFSNERSVPQVDMAFTNVTDIDQAPGTNTVTNLAPGVITSDTFDDTLHFFSMGPSQHLNVDLSGYVTPPTNDGVLIKAQGEDFRPFKEATLTAGKQYTFRVLVNGAAADRAYLNVWTNATDNQAPSITYHQIVKNLQVSNSSGYIDFDYTMPFIWSSSGGESAGQSANTGFRFRLTQIPDVSLTDNTTKKIIIGEQEFYKRPTMVSGWSLSTETIGGVGKFTYLFDDKIIERDPSTRYEEINVTKTRTPFTGTGVHTNAIYYEGTTFKITQTRPNEDWELLGVRCFLDYNGQDIPADRIKISSSGAQDVVSVTPPAVAATKIVSCHFRNAYGAEIKLSKNIVDRYSDDDQFELQIKEGDTVLHSFSTSGSETSFESEIFVVKGDKPYTLTEVMTNGDAARLSRYNTSISCTNTEEGSPTVLPAGEGQSFGLDVTPGDFISCEFTNTPLTVSAEKSTISAVPPVITADGTTSSVITVQVMDVNGNEIKSGGDKVTIEFVDAENHVGQFVGDVVDNEDGTYKY